MWREQALAHASAPNTIGILEGSDAALKKEYVLFTAHMDHIGTPSAGEGCVPRGADSICNGADDDGRHGGRDRAGGGLHLGP